MGASLVSRPTRPFRTRSRAPPPSLRKSPSTLKENHSGFRCPWSKEPKLCLGSSQAGDVRLEGLELNATPAVALTTKRRLNGHSHIPYCKCLSFRGTICK